MIHAWKTTTNHLARIDRKFHLPLALVLIAALTICVYLPVLHNEFINYDDNDYVTANMVVRQGLSLGGIVWAFSSFHAANWHPLTWLSHMLDVELFGLNPIGHHATSMLLHTINSILLCTLLYNLTGFMFRSTVVAMLFAIHPLHVESVAWIAERKDVLSTLFWLLTMMAYAAYVKKPSLSRYFSVAVIFTLGLMAKQMLVTLPFILLLMDYWPLNRLSFTKGKNDTDHTKIRAVLIEKIPLLALSLAASIIVIRAQDSGGGLSHSNSESFFLHTGNAFLSYVKYIRNMFWPLDLALFYPFDPSAITISKVAGAVSLLILITWLVIIQQKTRPYLFFGWFWYLITLLPVIGFIRVGGHAIADRYTYIPLIGLILIVVWVGAELAGKWENGLWAAGGGVVIVITVLSAMTIQQIRYWQNSYDLFNHALAVVEHNWMAHNNLGILLFQSNRYDEAIFHFRESVRLNPNSALGFKNLGNAYQGVGNYLDSIKAYREAIRINPTDAEAHYGLGFSYLLSRNIDLAYLEYQQLMGLDELHARSLLESIQMMQKSK